MASASDKARFYIEQTVPDLREWERRQLFTKAEISSINSQRTTYETQLNSREATVSLFLRYLTYDSNVSHLLSKRLTRHAVPPRSAQKLRSRQQRRLFSIIDRATRRFKSDLGLWTQYLHFCREQAATKRGQKVLAECLRLFPTRPEVWGYAAGWAEGSGDLSAARGYYLRGLRFCGNTKGGRDLYLRFARAELRWVGERRKLLGPERESVPNQKTIEANKRKDARAVEREQQDADVIAQPEAVQDDEDEEASEAAQSSDPTTFHHFSSTPAMTGAIPIAVFDQAMKAYGHPSDLAEAFFDMFAQFPELPCTRRILEHVIESMQANPKSDSATVRSCQCRLSLIGVAVDSPEFPGALRSTLKELKSAQAALEDQSAKSRFATKLAASLDLLASDDKLVPELKTVTEITTRQLSNSQALVSKER